MSQWQTQRATKHAYSSIINCVVNEIPNKKKVATLIFTIGAMAHGLRKSLTTTTKVSHTFKGIKIKHLTPPTIGIAEIFRDYMMLIIMMHSESVWFIRYLVARQITHGSAG